MFTRIVSSVVASLAICLFAGPACAQALSPEQQEVWKVEQQQWKMDAAKDMSWIDTLVHPNMRFWETGGPMPRDKASLKQWSRYESETSTVLEHELLPISATITGNLAVVQYYYRVARENDKKERSIVTGHYMDVLIKEATAAGDGRPLLASGLFAGSPRGSYGSLTARQIRAEALWARPALQ